MYDQVEKPKESKSKAIVNSVTQKKVKQCFGFVDNRKNKVYGHKTISQLKFNNFASGVIQRVSVDDSIRNVEAYSTLVQHYGRQTILDLMGRTGLRVRGHASGTGGDGMNAATTQDIKVLTDRLRLEAQQEGGEEEEKKEFQPISNTQNLRNNDQQQNQIDKNKQDKKKIQAEKKQQEFQKKYQDKYGKPPKKGGGKKK